MTAVFWVRYLECLGFIGSRKENDNLLAIFVFASKAAVVILMAYIVLVALYGSITSNPKIILMQGGLAILTLISSIF